jgi:ADP-heptose:LPS heptosyltransferase
MAKVAVYFCNGIGNLLMMTPAMQALGKLYDSKIDIVMSSNWNDYRSPIIKEVLDEWGLVNKVIMFPKDKFYPSRYKKLFTTAHTYPSQAGNLFQQKGEGYRQADWLNEYNHEVEYYMDEVYKLGYKGEIPSLDMPIADKPLLKGNKPKVALYNGAARLSQRYRWERKNWGKFDELAEEIHNFYDTDIIYLGGKSEQKEGDRLVKEFGFVTSYANKLTFMESAKAVKQCDLMISTDSALMHTAEVVDTPVVALFGSTMVSKNRPYKGKYSIVRGECTYMPCQYRSQFYTCKDYKCMDSISTGQVMKAVREMGVLNG